MKKKKLSITWIIIGIIGLLIIGTFIGSQAFPKTIIQQTDDGEYCYDSDQTYYLANSVRSLPVDWEMYVVGQNVQSIGSQLCLNVNPGYSDCYITDICPDCAINKISCACIK